MIIHVPTGTIQYHIHNILYGEYTQYTNKPHRGYLMIYLPLSPTIESHLKTLFVEVILSGHLKK